MNILFESVLCTSSTDNRTLVWEVNSTWNHMKFGRNVLEPIFSLWPISVYNHRTSVFISSPKAISSRVPPFTHPVLFRSNEISVLPNMFP